MILENGGITILLAKFPPDVSANGSALNKDLHTTLTAAVFKIPAVIVPAEPASNSIDVTVLYVLTEVTDEDKAKVSVCALPRTSVPVITASVPESELP